MNEWGREKGDPTDKIESHKWTEYFTKLLNGQSLNSTPSLKGQIYFELSLESKIKIEDLVKALRYLKAGKSPGPDGILIKYMKLFSETHSDTLLLLLNKIFSHHIYPTIWTTNFLKPIFTKGE